MITTAPPSRRWSTSSGRCRLPAHSTRSRTTKRVLPLWMDVENGALYPVFDSQRGSGVARRAVHCPDEASRILPQPGRPRLNEWRVPRRRTCRLGGTSAAAGPSAYHRRRGRKELLFSEASFQAADSPRWSRLGRRQEGRRPADARTYGQTGQLVRGAGPHGALLHRSRQGAGRVQVAAEPARAPHPRSCPRTETMAVCHRTASPGQGPRPAAPNGTVAIADFPPLRVTSARSLRPEVRPGQSSLLMLTDRLGVLFLRLRRARLRAPLAGVSPVADRRFIRLEAARLRAAEPPSPRLHRLDSAGLPPALPLLPGSSPLLRGAFRVVPSRDSRDPSSRAAGPTSARFPR